MGLKYSLGMLQALGTIRSNHTEDLKMEGYGMRVWLSRMTKRDGAKYDNGVRVERLIGNDWVTTEEYPAV